MIEQLVRINAKGVNLEGVSGGLSEFTTSDLSACLAGADDIGVMVLMRRIAGDTSTHTKAYQQLLKGVIELSGNKWKANKLKDLLNLCLYEHINPVKCPTCKGTGIYRYRPCNRCKGTTNYTLSDAQKAQALNIDRSNWARTWKKRHRQVTDYLNEKLPIHEGKAVKKLFKRLKTTA